MLSPVVSTETILQRVREAALRLGRERAADRPDGHKLLVNADWVLTACPAFAAGWKSGAVAVEDVVAGAPAFAHRCVAFLAADDFFAAAELPGDPVGELLAAVDPFSACFPLRERMGDGRWLTAHAVDGIAYEFEWATHAVRGGRFEFGNPRTGALVALERGLFDLAVRVAERTGSPQAGACIETWRSFVARRAEAEPRAPADRGLRGE
ncbi:MAG: hypothetical protein J0H41_15185 [Rhizobiales bacterium]|nr:hypothetical protein [Hyphomicrobiales bacterium]